MDRAVRTVTGQAVLQTCTAKTTPTIVCIAGATTERIDAADRSRSRFHQLTTRFMPPKFKAPGLPAGIPTVPGGRAEVPDRALGQTLVRVSSEQRREGHGKVASCLASTSPGGPETPENGGLRPPFDRRSPLGSDPGIAP